MINKGEIPFVRLLVPLICGIAFAIWFVPTTIIYHSAWLLSILLFFVFLASNVSYSYFSIYKFKWLPGILLHVFVFLTGYCLCVAKSEKLDQNHFSKLKSPAAFTVNITNEPKLSGDILRFETRINQAYSGNRFVPASGNLLIALKIDSTNQHAFKYGDLLLIPAVFNEIEPPYNPGEFDFKNFLTNHAIYHQAFIYQAQISLLKENTGNAVIAFSLQLRQRLVKKFVQYIKDKDAAAVASTLILGYRADLSKEILSAYSKTGTMHVLSVSGMHVGIVFLFLSAMLKFMDKSRQLKIAKAVLIITLIWSYALITGFSPSVCRSVVTLSFIIAGQALSKSKNTYNLVAASAVLLLLYNPYFLVDVGFQLSYFAVLGLIFFYPKVYHLFIIHKWFGDKMWQYISLSFCAQLATFPISIYYFHQFPLYFLVSNIFIILPVEVMMYSGLAFILIPIEIVQRYLGVLLNYIIIFTNKGLFYIENLPLASLGGLWISTWHYLLLYVIIFLVIFSILYKYKRLLQLSIVGMLVLIISFSVIKIKKTATRRIVFYSLRKNTAVGFFNAGNAYLYSDLSLTDKTVLFSIKPSLELSGASKIQSITPSADFNNSEIYINRNFVQFCNWKMLAWDSTFNRQTFKNKIFVDALLLRGNPKVTVKNLSTAVHFNLLFIDGTNPDYKIHQWKSEADALGYKSYILKKNTAFQVFL